MSKPNFKVIMALMESYLVFRQADWGVLSLPNDRVKLPEKEWNLNKAKTCVRIMERLAKKKDMQTADWVEFCSFLYEEELVEEKLYNSSLFNRSHSLLNLIRAMRSYVILMIQDELASFKITDIAKHATALTTKEDYLMQFFDTHIKVNDPKYKELAETDFNSFVNSVVNTKQRKRSLCKGLFNTLHIPVPNANNNLMSPPADMPEVAAAAAEVKKAPTFASVVANSTFKKPTPPAPRKNPDRKAKTNKRSLFDLETSPEAAPQSASQRQTSRPKNGH